MINKYIPLGSAKGYSEKEKRWIYGWYWKETPYQCFETTQKIKHYIRYQNNIDLGLKKQEDY